MLYSAFTCHCKVSYTYIYIDFPSNIYSQYFIQTNIQAMPNSSVAIITLISLNLLIIITMSSSYMVKKCVPFGRHLVKASSFRNQLPSQLFMSSSSSSSTDTVVSRCTKKITDALNAQKVTVTANNDDPNGSHIQIVCISNEFKGKTSVQRQRAIYKAIWDEMSGPVHAVDSIIAKTPEEVNL